MTRTKARRNYIWVVEMQNSLRPIKRWETTVGAQLSKDWAREELRRWRKNNPYDKFRLRKYEAV